MESMRIEIICESREEVLKYLTWLPGEYKEIEVDDKIIRDERGYVTEEDTSEVKELEGEQSLPFLMQAELKNSKSTKIWTCFRAIGGLISFIAAGIIFILDQLGILK